MWIVNTLSFAHKVNKYFNWQTNIIIISQKCVGIGFFLSLSFSHNQSLGRFQLDEKCIFLLALVVDLFDVHNLQVLQVIRFVLHSTVFHSVSFWVNDNFIIFSCAAPVACWCCFMILASFFRSFAALLLFQFFLVVFSHFAAAFVKELC